MLACRWLAFPNVWRSRFGIRIPFFAPSKRAVSERQKQVALTQPYQALKDAPKEIRQAAFVALLASSFTRALGILVSTIIIATLPTWVPGLLAQQPIPIALLVLTVGCTIVAGKGSRIREKIASREFEKARGSSLSAAVLGFVVAGVIPGILYVYLYTRVGNVMVKRTPDDPKTIYLLPHPSEGMFLGRYLGWIAAYLLVLYIGYTQLPPGLKGISDWLSPIFGVHFNTLIVAVYLVFTNPLTYPPLFQLWMIAGLLGGLIAGGRVGRGFMVGLAVFLSTMGAMGLAALSIYRNLSLASFANIPPPPSSFSLVSAATGPVASDLIPLFLQASSPTDPAFIQQVALTLARNAGLAFAIVTISGRAASLFWQGGIGLARFVFVILHGKPGLKVDRTIVDRPALKTTILLLALLSLFAIPQSTTQSPISQAPPAGPYEQNLAIALDVLGSPNASLSITNLDLSSRGLVLDNNYAGSNMTVFIVNNNDSQAFGNGPQSSILQAISQPALITVYSGNPKTTASQSTAVEAQFSQALGVPLTTIFTLPTGQGSATVYAPNPELSNGEALAKLISLLPTNSFSSLIGPARIQNLKYFAAIGLLPAINGISFRAISFYLNIQWPRQFYKEGPHQLDVKSLLGFSSNIVGDPAANVSIITMTFQRGTILYSPLFPNPSYNNATSTYFLDVTSSSRPDFVANFKYPFAPNIIIQKTIAPSSGPVGTTHAVIVTVQNLDNVTVSKLNATDPQASSVYLQTLQISPSGVQTSQASILAPSNTLTLSYAVTTQSSGIYVLSPATVAFLWTAPNGTRIRYSINTDTSQVTSLSGPLTQFTRTFNDLLPYSLLLLVPLFVTPIMETLRFLGRHNQRKKERAMLAQQGTPSTLIPPKPPEASSGTNSSVPY